MRTGSQLFGFTVPAFVTRKADTLVRLKDGQTLIIAGLILRNRNAVVSKVPYLGDIPYAGAMFRNTSWQDSGNRPGDVSAAGNRAAPCHPMLKCSNRPSADL